MSNNDNNVIEQVASQTEAIDENEIAVRMECLKFAKSVYKENIEKKLKMYSKKKCKILT